MYTDRQTHTCTLRVVNRLQLRFLVFSALNEAHTAESSALDWRCLLLPGGAQWKPPSEAGNQPASWQSCAVRAAHTADYTDKKMLSTHLSPQSAQPLQTRRVPPDDVAGDLAGWAHVPADNPSSVAPPLAWHWHRSAAAHRASAMPTHCLPDYWPFGPEVPCSWMIYGTKVCPPCHQLLLLLLIAYPGPWDGGNGADVVPAAPACRKSRTVMRSAGFWYCWQWVWV